MVTLVWAVHGIGNARGSAGGAIPAMEGSDPRWAPRRRDRLGERGVPAEKRCAGDRWDCGAGPGGARASAADCDGATRQRCPSEAAASAQPHWGRDYDNEHNEV